ncbi:MAG: ABC transporter ATP-binding protein [Cyanobacteria bacterium P01_G01_bin.54]
MTQPVFAQPPTGLWSLMVSVKERITAAIALSVLSAITSLGSLLTIPPIAAELLTSTPHPATIWRWLAIAVGMVAIAFSSRFLAFAVSHRAAYQLEVILRTALATHLAQVPLGYVVTTGSGTIKKWVQDDVQSLHAFVADSTPLIGQACTMPLLALLTMLVTDWRLGLVTLAVLPVGMIFVRLAFRDYGEQRQAYDRANEQINNIIIEFVQGMQVVRTFDDGSSSFARFQTALNAFTQKHRALNAKTHVSGRLGMLLFEPLPTLLLVSTVGGWLMLQGMLSLPKLLVFLLLAPRLCGALKPLLTLSAFINQANAGALRISKVLAEPSLPQPLHPKQPQDASITLSNVTFGYRAGRPALQGVSLTIPTGTVTALVGPSGAGKTTLARLIPRFWDVTEGAIQIGGVDVRQMTPEILMSWVSFVFQDPFLLHDTIRNNIKLGRPDASDREVEAAAQAAQAHEFILALPRGYDTIAGERGTHLSGGQRQRITIARAILQNNPIVVLDEATAFADPENEALIQGAIAALTQNKTLIIIAHRLPSIINADQIAVFEQGRLVELGQHQKLIAANGPYARLWSCHQATQNWQLRMSFRSVSTAATHLP